jgi:Mn2+/Fe2+ NRAMP family transporter
VIIAMIPGLPVVNILVFLYLINGLLLPIILFSILKLINDRELMGKYTNSLFFNILAYGLAGMVSFLSVAYVLIQILGLFGLNILS